MTESVTDYAVATGDFIDEWLTEHHMTVAELALRSGDSYDNIERVIAGAPVTSEFAQRLESVTHVPAKRWLALEAQYRADLDRLARPRATLLGH